MKTVWLCPLRASAPSCQGEISFTLIAYDKKPYRELFIFDETTLPGKFYDAFRWGQRRGALEAWTLLIIQRFIL